MKTFAGQRWTVVSVGIRFRASCQILRRSEGRDRKEAGSEECRLLLTRNCAEGQGRRRESSRRLRRRIKENRLSQNIHSIANA